MFTSKTWARWKRCCTIRLLPPLVCSEDEIDEIACRLARLLR